MLHATMCFIRIPSGDSVLPAMQKIPYCSVPLSVTDWLKQLALEISKVKKKKNHFIWIDNSNSNCFNLCEWFTIVF